MPPTVFGIFWTLAGCFMSHSSPASQSRPTRLFEKGIACRKDINKAPEWLKAQRRRQRDPLIHTKKHTLSPYLHSAHARVRSHSMHSFPPRPEPGDASDSRGPQHGPACLLTRLFGSQPAARTLQRGSGFTGQRDSFSRHHQSRFRHFEPHGGIGMEFWMAWQLNGKDCVGEHARLHKAWHTFQAVICRRQPRI